MGFAPPGDELHGKPIYAPPNASESERNRVYSWPPTSATILGSRGSRQRSSPRLPIVTACCPEPGHDTRSDHPKGGVSIQRRDESTARRIASASIPGWSS